MIELVSTGNFKYTEAFLRKMERGSAFSSIQGYAQEGVNALAAATPTDSGLAAQSWTVRVENSSSQLKITWSNFDIERGFPVAIMLQYGYSTGTGGYVAGRDYINPAMKPIFDSIADRVWKAVTSA